jgi:excisionase family DNA binding protein
METATEKLVITVPEAGKKLGISREAAYAAARRGEIPTIRIGHLLKVPLVQLNKLLAGAS